MAVSLRALADHLGGRVLGDPERVITGARALAEAEAEHLSVVQHPKELRRKPLSAIRAGVLLCPPAFAADHADEVESDLLILEEPYLGLARALTWLYPEPARAPGVDPRAAVHKEASLGDGVTVGPFAVIGRARLGSGCAVGSHVFVDDDVEVGQGARVGPGCVLLRGVRLGARVILQPGAVLGADGFGYAPEGPRNIKVPQVGGVAIDDDVEVGANACIDRGALSDTRVGRGAKLDDLVLVGHGAEVGEDAVLVGQVGLAGGARIGDRAVLAGQAGVGPFVEVGADARVGARGGVTRDMPPAAAWSGMPAIPHSDWLKASVRLRRLDSLFTRLSAAEQRIAELEARLKASPPQPTDEEPDD